ncbi:BTAD domain-containing putative transcriptional regulator [Streptomyces sp. NPDC059396]|uniref:BTAD domain-containing putative transcriptional regulator n=1 Tax=Streptomyces sp. NPDC059396 TaxID=3346819 RepID=UPI0036857ED1
MRFGVLGPLEVWSAEGRLVPVPEVKVRTLLADLLAHHGEVVPTGRLIEDLWGGSAYTARPTSSLQAKVSQLRRALENAEAGARSLIAHQAPGYTIDIPAEALDIGRFRALVAEARICDEPRAKAAVLTDALSLWRGPAFADFADQPFVRSAAAALEEERLAAVEVYAETRLELGEHSVLVGELTTLVDRFPLREGLRAVQMRTLYRAGRPSEALDSYADLRRRLDEELGLMPGPALDALQQAILRHDPQLARQESRTDPATAARVRTNLTGSVSTLVGRDEAMDEVRSLISRQRLVTLTGPGGVGKTRLAAATVNGLSAEFPDGAWLVELAGACAPERAMGSEPLAERIMAVLGIRESAFDSRAAGAGQRLADVLASQRLVLVLDSCEYAIDDVARLAGPLLDSAPGLHILATSQEPLRISGETVWPVPSLGLPLPGEDRLDTVLASSAVRLFVDRVRATDPDFSPDTATVRRIAEICRRLDGIPLALELAATRVRALGVDELYDRLDDRFRILTSGYRDAPHRHRTLQATIDWSWSLLDTREQTVLRRLSVFAEGCDLEAAEQVCSGAGMPGEDVVDALAVLVDRSLALRSDSPAGARYRLLESVAAYGQQRLGESGESGALAARHLRYYTELAERAQPHLHGRDQRRWLRRLDGEAANFQRALEEARRTDDAHRALRLSNALSWYRFLRGRLGEARRALATALAVEGEVTGGKVTPTERAEAASWHAGFSMLLGEGASYIGPAKGGSDEAERESEREVGQVRAEWFLGAAHWSVGVLSAGEDGVQRALQNFRALRDSWGTAAALSSRAALALARGDLDALRDNALEARAQFTELGEQWGQLKAAEVLSVLAEINGSYEQAEQLHREGLRIAEALELWPEVSRQLSGLGRIAILERRYREAEDFHTRAQRLAIEQGNRPAEQFAALGLALGARREGNLEVAEARLRPWLTWNRSRYDAPGLALVLAELGFIAEQRGDAVSALTLHQDGLATAMATGDPRAVALALEGLAGAHSLAGLWGRAARLLGTAAATRRRAGAPQPPAEQADVERIAARLRGVLGEEAYAAEFSAGERTDHVTQAAAETEQSPSPKSL